jgi:hypothetical protein
MAVDQQPEAANPTPVKIRPVGRPALIGPRLFLSGICKYGCSSGVGCRQRTVSPTQTKPLRSRFWLSHRARRNTWLSSQRRACVQSGCWDDNTLKMWKHTKQVCAEGGRSPCSAKILIPGLTTFSPPANPPRPPLSAIPRIGNDDSGAPQPVHSAEKPLRPPEIICGRIRVGGSGQNSDDDAASKHGVLILHRAERRATCEHRVSVNAELRQHFSEEQLIEFAASAARENFRARFNRVFNVASDGLYRKGLTFKQRHAA